MDITRNFLKFLECSPTAFHAAEQIRSFLSSIGFTSLKEGDSWNLEHGRGYFVSRGAAAVAAFFIPEKTPVSSHILASHLDSPGLKLKGKETEHRFSYTQLSTEIYGSPILHSWLDRDLVLSGNVITLNHQGKIEPHLVSLSESPFIIPQLALHLDRTIADKGFTVHKQDHLKPILSLSSDPVSLESLLQKQISFEKLLSFDLFLTPVEKPSLLGINQELIASHKLDNLTSAFAAMHAFAFVDRKQPILPVSFFFDHEEIGSMTYSGADSVFAGELLHRICQSLGMDLQQYLQFKAKSFVVSADLAHGLHPNFTEKYDLEQAPHLGKGVVMKYNANQKYANSADLTAKILQIAAHKKIPIQSFYSRSDIPTGSTVGSIMAARLGIPTLDLGISSLAMHSIRETISTQDELSLCSLFQEIFR